MWSNPSSVLIPTQNPWLIPPWDVGCLLTLTNLVNQLNKFISLSVWKKNMLSYNSLLGKSQKSRFFLKFFLCVCFFICCCVFFDFIHRTCLSIRWHWYCLIKFYCVLFYEKSRGFLCTGTFGRFPSLGDQHFGL